MLMRHCFLASVQLPKFLRRWLMHYSGVSAREGCAVWIITLMTSSLWCLQTRTVVFLHALEEECMALGIPLALEKKAGLKMDYCKNSDNCRQKELFKDFDYFENLTMPESGCRCLDLCMNYDFSNVPRHCH